MYTGIYKAHHLLVTCHLMGYYLIGLLFSAFLTFLIHCPQLFIGYTVGAQKPNLENEQHLKTELFKFSFRMVKIQKKFGFRMVHTI